MKKKIRRHSNAVKKKSKHNPELNSQFNSLLDQIVSLFRFNINFKLAVGYAVQITFLFVCIAILAYYGACQFVWRDANNEFRDVTNSFSIFLEDSSNYSSEKVLSFAAENKLYFSVYDPNLTLIYSYPQQFAEEYNASNLENNYQWWSGHLFPDIYKRFILTTEDDSSLTLVLKKPLYPEIDFFNLYLPPIVIGLLILLTITIQSSAKMARKHLEPIHTMTSQVRQISAQSLDTRLDIRGTRDELKDLAHTFNLMLDGIAHSYEREKQFVSDASHELRTPIAVIKGYAALLQRWGKDDPEVLNESIQAIVSEADSMQSLVESLLFIARKDRGTLQMEFEDFDISELVNDIIRDTKLIDKQHKLLVDVVSPLQQNGSADKLKQAFRILVDNSIKYTPEDGIIQIELKASEQHNIFMISDTGIGISKEDLPYVFDRFYRADKSRSRLKEKDTHGGTGLGLSIAKIIIEQHGGRVLVESELNIGTKFSVFLPKQAIAKK